MKTIIAGVALSASLGAPLPARRWPARKTTGALR